VHEEVGGAAGGECEDVPADDDAVGAVFGAGDVLLQDEGPGWGGAKV